MNIAVRGLNNKEYNRQMPEEYASPHVPPHNRFNHENTPTAPETPRVSQRA